MPGVCRALTLSGLAVSLFGISGCKRNSPPVKLVETSSTILIGTDDNGKPEPHQPIAQNQIVNWRSPAKFSITFQKDKDPCVATQSGHDDTYISKDPSGSDPEYTLACTISNNPRPGDKFRYGISFIQAANASATPSGAASATSSNISVSSSAGSVTGCGGCVLEVDSQ